jgi:hypothetical protein
MGKYATCDVVTHLVDKLAINNDAITTTFVTPIVYEHRSTINFPHKTRLCAAIELVQIDQTLTQRRFKYAGKFDDRGLTVPKSRGLPQLCDRLEHQRDIRTVVSHRNDRTDRQSPINDYPGRAKRMRTVVPIRTRNAKQPGYGLVEVVEKRKTRHIRSQLGCLGRLITHTEKEHMLTVEGASMSSQQMLRALPCR